MKDKDQSMDEISADNYKKTSLMSSKTTNE